MQNTSILEGVQARSHSSGWNLPLRTPPDLSQFGLREQYWGGPDLRSARPGASGPPRPPRSAPACVLRAAREGVSRGGRISPPLRAVAGAAGTAPGADVHGGERPPLWPRCRHREHPGAAERPRSVSVLSTRGCAAKRGRARVPGSSAGWGLSLGAHPLGPQGAGSHTTPRAHAAPSPKLQFFPFLPGFSRRREAKRLPPGRCLAPTAASAPARSAGSAALPVGAGRADGQAACPRAAGGGRGSPPGWLPWDTPGTHAG